jgi:hypothetical protein
MRPVFDEAAMRPVRVTCRESKRPSLQNAKNELSRKASGCSDPVMQPWFIGRTQAGLSVTTEGG